MKKVAARTICKLTDTILTVYYDDYNTGDYEVKYDGYGCPLHTALEENGGNSSAAYLKARNTCNCGNFRGKKDVVFI